MKKLITLLIIVGLLFTFSLETLANQFENQGENTDNLEQYTEGAEGEEYYNEDELSHTNNAENSSQTITAKAKVIEIIERKVELDTFTGVEMESITAKVKILEGEYKGQELIAQSYRYPGGGKGYGSFQMKPNDKVFIQIQLMDDEIVYIDVMDYSRDTPTYVLIGLFMAVLLFFGRKQGLKSIITLAFTLIVIFKFMLPLLVEGYSPVLLALSTGTIVTAATFLMVSGFTRKTVAAIAGTVGGLSSAAIISFIFSNAMKLTGIHGEEERMLQLVLFEIKLDFQGILLAGIIIGALGAVMDVAISIASAMDEVYKVNPTVKMKQLFQSGMNVGRDIMGTMANTLILAYVGAALPLLMMIDSYEAKFSELIHMEFLVAEILRTIAGSVGLILSIPITAFVTSLLIKKVVKK